MAPRSCAVAASSLLFLWLASCAAVLASDAGACAPSSSSPAECHAADEEVNLLQHALRVDRQGRLGRDEVSTCAALTNEESGLTVKVGIGTPPQYFNTYVNTGFDDLVIPSCSCATCPSTDACFDDKKSPTSSLSNLGVMLSYGIGDIEAVLATDVVNVSGIATVLDNGVLLMVDRQVNISVPFEGLLGLGLPKDDSTVPMFLPSAGVQRFSVCYQSAGGALELDVPPLPTAMEQIGTIHWGLGLWGISVGSAEIPVLACGEDAMTHPGQWTPCGAIPDSGQTVLMGPETQIISIFAKLCDDWERCASVTQGADAVTKANEIQDVLMGCDDWPEGDEGIDEMPSVFWKFGGAGGAEQTIELTPWNYVSTMTAEEYIISGARGRYGHPRLTVQVVTKRVCLLDFGVDEHPTSSNGDVWLMGLPLFHQYKVHFDQTSPMKIGFSTDACELCEDKVAKAALLAEKIDPLGSNRTGLRHATRRKLRRVSKPVRMPDFNRSLPL